MSAKLYDHSSGQWVEVPDDQVDGAVRSGNYTFEDGVKIPTVSPTGELGTLDAKDAYEAFTKNSFRWQNQTDRNDHYDRESAQIRQRAAEAPGAAFAGGMARTMSGGLSDVVVPKIAEVVSGGAITDAEGRQLLDDTYKQSPIATGGGEMAGLLVPNPISKVGGAVTGATKAAGVVSRVAPKVLAGAAEGATFGLTQGISEAALGDNKEVLDNLISHVGTGMLLGGGLGAAFSGLETVSPFLKDKLGKAADKGSDLVRGAIRSGSGNAMKAVLSIAGQKEAGVIAKDLATHPEVMRLLQEGRIKEAEAFVADANVARSEFAKQTKRAEKDLAQKFATMEKPVQHEITRGLEQTGGDMRQALDDLYARTKLADDDLDQLLATPAYSTAPHNQVQELESRVQKMITDLEVAPGKGTRPAARELKDALVSTFAKTEFTLADEMRAYKNFRNVARQMESRPGVGELASKFRSDIDEMVMTHPDQVLTDMYERVIKPQDAMDALHDVVSKTIKDPNYSKLGAVLTSPEKFEAIRPMLEDLSSYAPEIAKFQNTVGSYQERQSILRAARDRISEAKQASVDGKVSLDDMEEIFKLVTPKRGDIMSKIDDVKRASEILRNAQDADPLTAGILFQRAMGKDVSSMEKLLPLRDKMAAYQRLKDMNIEPGIGRTAATYVGGLVGGPAGAALANGAVTALSPVKALKTLAAVDSAASKGAALFKAAAGRLIDGISSGPVRRVTQAAMSSPTDRRNQYKKLAVQLPRMQDPEHLTNMLADATAGVPGMPSLKLEMQARLATASGFLQSKLPVDYTVGTSPFGSQFEPSDQEVETFMRYAAAVDKPLEVIDRMSEGTVTPEEIEALKMVHPDLYARLQRTVMDGIIAKGSEIPYSSKLMLSSIFDMPTDYTLQPEFVAEMQDFFADQDQGAQSAQQTARPKTQKSKLKLNPLTTVATEATKVSEGKYGA